MNISKLPSSVKWSEVNRKRREQLSLQDADSQLDLYAPRACNTGAQISSPPKMSSKIDWLEFTVKEVDPSYSIVEYLALSPDDFSPADYGMQGYSDVIEYGFVKVLSSPSKPERGTKVILSGQALDEVGRDALEIIKRVLRDGGTFARVDLALDDRAGYLSIDQLWQTELDGNAVSHFKDVSPIKKYNRHTKELCANGVNWGSRSSSRFVRAYDKQLERKYRADEETGHWVRVELQANKRGALVVAASLADNGLESIPQIICGCLDFRDRSKEKNSARADRLSWWSAFVGSVEPIKTGLKKVIKTVEDKAQWLSRQCKKSMGQVAVAFSGSSILDMIQAGIESTTKREWEQLFPDRNIENFMDDIRRDLKPCPF